MKRKACLTRAIPATTIGDMNADTNSGSTTLAQLDSMLTGFRSGEVKLGDLIDNVPHLVKKLDVTDAPWKDRFIGYWWTLEQVHSEAIDLGESRRLPPERREAVDEAIDGMIDLVRVK